MKTPLTWNVVVFGIAAASASATPADVYVDAANPVCAKDPGGGSGTAADPFSRIQDGLDAAQPGDLVSVAEGVYRGERNRDLSFGGKPVTLECRFTDASAGCVIDAENAARGFLFWDEPRDAIRLKRK